MEEKTTSQVSQPPPKTTEHQENAVQTIVISQNFGKERQEVEKKNS